MLGRRNFLYIYGISPEKWAKRWGILPFERPCRDCGAPMCTTIPVTCGKVRGLIAPHCSCGSTDNPPFCVVFRDEDLASLSRRSDERSKRRVNRRTASHEDDARDRVARTDSRPIDIQTARKLRSDVPPDSSK